MQARRCLLEADGGFCVVCQCAILHCKVPRARQQAEDMGWLLGGSRALVRFPGRGRNSSHPSLSPLVLTVCRRESQVQQILLGGASLRRAPQGHRPEQLTPTRRSGRGSGCSAWEGRRGLLADTSVPPASSSSAPGAGCPHPEGPSLHHQPEREPPPRVGGGAPGWGHPCAGQPAAPNVSPDVSRRPEVSGPGLPLRSQVVNTA